MSLNCKQGDLAMMKCATPDPDNGKIVRIVESGDDWSHTGDARFHWAVDTLGQRFELDNAPGLSDGVELLDIPDADLRPIRDNDGADETLAWAGKPEEVKREFVVSVVTEAGTHQRHVPAAHPIDAIHVVLGEFPAARRISARVA